MSSIRNKVYYGNDCYKLDATVTINHCFFLSLTYILFDKYLYFSWLHFLGSVINIDKWHRESVTKSKWLVESEMLQKHLLQTKPWRNDTICQHQFMYLIVTYIWTFVTNFDGDKHCNGHNSVHMESCIINFICLVFVDYFNGSVLHSYLLPILPLIIYILRSG